jgi:hypothetical protein
VTTVEGYDGWSTTDPARGNLASWRGQAGDPAGAALTLEQLVDDYLRVHGPDHPHTVHAHPDTGRW